MEAFDAIRANLALTIACRRAAMIHSDDPHGIQRLNQEVAKAMAAGAAAGIPMTEEQAVKWMTINPAWALGLDDDRVARGGQERRRRALVRRSVQRLCARRESLDRWRAPVRPERHQRPMADGLRVRLRTRRAGSERAGITVVTSRIVTGWRRSGVWRVVISIATLLSGASAGSGSAQTVAIVGGTVYTVSGPEIEHGIGAHPRRSDRGSGRRSAGARRGKTRRRDGQVGHARHHRSAETPLGLVEVGSGVDDARDTRARGRDGIAAAFTAVDGLQPGVADDPAGASRWCNQRRVMPEGA